MNKKSQTRLRYGILVGIFLIGILYLNLISADPPGPDSNPANASNLEWQMTYQSGNEDNFIVIFENEKDSFWEKWKYWLIFITIIFFGLFLFDEKRRRNKKSQR